MFQGVILKEEQREKRREKEKRMTRRDQASVSEAHDYFQKELLYLYLYIEGNERCKVIVSPNITSVLSLSKPGFFLHTFPINNVVYNIFWPWRPVDIL